jgi:hypothetical protein
MKPAAESARTGYEWLDRCTESDFDGHGNFGALTPNQRLEWLAQAADLLRAFKGLARGAGAAARPAREI